MKISVVYDMEFYTQKTKQEKNWKRKTKTRAKITPYVIKLGPHPPGFANKTTMSYIQLVGFKLSVYQPESYQSIYDS